VDGIAIFRNVLKYLDQGKRKKSQEREPGNIDVEAMSAPFE